MQKGWKYTELWFHCNTNIKVSTFSCKVNTDYKKYIYNGYHAMKPSYIIQQQ